jgi:glutathione S-transferase
MQPSLTLFVDAQYASPYAMSAYVALSVKQLAFDVRTVDLAADAQHEPAFAGMSLTRRVPTLVHGDFALSESSAIAEYVDEVFPGTALYPSDPQRKARARQVQAWLRSDLLPIRMERTTEVVFYGAPAPALSAVAEAAAGKLLAAVQSLLPAGQDHLCGEWCIADVDLALMLNRLVLNGDAVPQRLADYARRQWRHPAVQRWVAFERPAL